MSVLVYIDVVVQWLYVFIVKEPAKLWELDVTSIHTSALCFCMIYLPHIP